MLITKKPLRLLFFSAMFLIAGNCNAQFTGLCKDTTLIQLGYSCPSEYKPICGCDGKTYRNDCVAKFHNGIQNYSDGCCGSFDFDLAPTNDITDLLQLKVTSKTTGVLIVTIYDPFGNRKIEFPITVNSAETIGYVPEFFYVDLSTLPTGVYLIGLASSNNKEVKRFLKFKTY